MEEFLDLPSLSEQVNKTRIEQATGKKVFSYSVELLYFDVSIVTESISIDIQYVELNKNL